MRASLFWFSDDQWAKIEPLVPTNRPGPRGLSAGIRPVYDGLQSLQPLERARNLAVHIRDGGRVA
jgi:hypothetical protein